MHWATAASVAGRVGKKAYDHRHTIQKYWTKAKAYLDVGGTQIVVTGHAGAGKTILAGQMHGRARELVYEVPTESRKVEVDAITAGEWTKLVRVLPGQTGYRTKGEIESFQNNPKLEGVIHVVDYGYVAPRDPVVAKTLIEVDQIDTLEKLREKNLRTEIEGLITLLADVRKLRETHGKPDWLVIAVNKVDLFPNERNIALKYYHPKGGGEFGTLLREYQNHVGEQNFPIHVLQTCAYETAFFWNGLKVPSSLERQEQDELLRVFMEAIAAISEAH